MVAAGLGSQKTKKFIAGEYVFNEGDIGSEVFILKKGSVEVVKDLGGTEVVLATLKTGDFFGEMALFGNKKQGAFCDVGSS